MLPSYRNDIDGLRALAVGAVVLFHCGFVRYVPGGFVGVDVFFVISGFMITGSLQEDLTAGSFSLTTFYARRIRRLFPTIFVVYIFIIGTAFCFMLPSQIGRVTSTLLSSLFFVSNISFYGQTGYFDHASGTNPLLHTWSLSVEEQFYVLFPLLLLAIWHRARSRFQSATWIGGVALTGLAASAWMVRKDESAAFYLVQYRAWELLIGSFVALSMPPFGRSKLVTILSITGLLVIIASILVLNSTVPFPGFAAIPAVTGAAFILYSGERCSTPVGYVLSLPPFRFIGQISYSLYLWHWPIWVYGNMAVYDAHGWRGYLGYLSFDVVIAWLSWKFIEQPFRRKPFRTEPLRVIGYAAVGTVTIMFCALFEQPIAARIWIVSSQVDKIASFVDYDASVGYRADSCFLTTSSNDFSRFQKESCLELSDNKPNVLLIGDSHAAQFNPGLQSDPKINVLEAAASNCKPTIPLHGASWCTDLFQYVFYTFLPKHRIDAIILSARWQSTDLPSIVKTVEFLARQTRRLVILGPIVEYDSALPRLLASELYSGDATLVRRHRSREPLAIDAAMRELLDHSNASYVSVYNAICPNGDCALYASDKIPIQFDYGHLTAEGSIFVVSRIRGSLRLPEAAIKPPQ